MFSRLKGNGTKGKFGTLILKKSNRREMNGKFLFSHTHTLLITAMFQLIHDISRNNLGFLGLGNMYADIIEDTLLPMYFEYSLLFIQEI